MLSWQTAVRARAHPGRRRSREEKKQNKEINNSFVAAFSLSCSWPTKRLLEPSERVHSIAMAATRGQAHLEAPAPSASGTPANRRPFGANSARINPPRDCSRALVWKASERFIARPRVVPLLFKLLLQGAERKNNNTAQRQQWSADNKPHLLAR